MHVFLAFLTQIADHFLTSGSAKAGMFCNLIIVYLQCKIILDTVPVTTSLGKFEVRLGDVSALFLIVHLRVCCKESCTCGVYRARISLILLHLFCAFSSSPATFYHYNSHQGGSSDMGKQSPAPLARYTVQNKAW